MFWEVSIDASVDSCSIVIFLELVELSLEVERVPEKEVIEILATDCSDEALDVRMRVRCQMHLIGSIQQELSQSLTRSTLPMEGFIPWLPIVVVGGKSECSITTSKAS